MWGCGVFGGSWGWGGGDWVAARSMGDEFPGLRSGEGLGVWEGGNCVAASLGFGVGWGVWCVRWGKEGGFETRPYRDRFELR